MSRMRAIFIIFVIALLFLVIGSFALRNREQQPSTEKIDLTVHVVNQFDKSPVTNVWVVAISNGLVMDKQSPDEKGYVFFQLPSGRYDIKISTGYTGQSEIDLQSNQSIELEVLPVLQ